VQVFKIVSQKYTPTTEILQLLEDFRKMTNEVIRIAVNENLTSRFQINRRCYKEFECYPYHTNFRLNAVNIATGLLHNFKKSLRKQPNTKKPYLTKRFARIFGSEVVRVEKEHLWFMLRPNKKLTPLAVAIPLHEHTIASLSGHTLRSVTLTACTLSIAFSKDMIVTKPKGLIGLDRNLDNVTSANLEGKTTVYDLSEATKIKLRYREIKSHFRRNDARIRKKIYCKYGKRQRNRVNQRLHLVSKAIVQQAKQTNSGIVMEDLKGIRKLYRKGNGQGTYYRSRLNTWSFYTLQTQIQEKAKWLGIPVLFVKAAKTSSTCAICGSLVSECTERKVWCGKCQHLMDRDENAAFNIVKKGFLLEPVGPASEAMVKEPPQTAILKVDAGKQNPLQVRVC
jgi:putative transposase